MDNYTKGEWIKQNEISVDGYHIYSRLTDDDLAIVVDKSDDGTGEDETEANARLMVAAPKMAELLLESREFIGGDWRERRDEVLKEAGVLS
jgi:hypothetical protein